MAASEVPSNPPDLPKPKVRTSVEIPKPKPESLENFGVLGRGRFGSSARTRIADKVFRVAMLVAALSIFGIVLLVLWELIYKSQMTLHQFGWKFFIGQDWDPVAGNFGALPFIYGTLVSSLLALV